MKRVLGRGFRARSYLCFLSPCTQNLFRELFTGLNWKIKCVSRETLHLSLTVQFNKVHVCTGFFPLRTSKATFSFLRPAFCSSSHDVLRNDEACCSFNSPLTVFFLKAAKHIFLLCFEILKGLKRVWLEPHTQSLFKAMECMCASIHKVAIFSLWCIYFSFSSSFESWEHSLCFMDPSNTFFCSILSRSHSHIYFEPFFFQSMQTIYCISQKKTL